MRVYVANDRADYIRRQTLTGAERFATPELSQMEQGIEASSIESHKIATARRWP